MQTESLAFCYHVCRSALRAYTSINAKKRNTNALVRVKQANKLVKLAINQQKNESETKDQPKYVGIARTRPYSHGSAYETTKKKKKLLFFPTFSLVRFRCSFRFCIFGQMLITFLFCRRAFPFIRLLPFGVALECYKPSTLPVRLLVFFVSTLHWCWHLLLLFPLFSFGCVDRPTTGNTLFCRL